MVSSTQQTNTDKAVPDELPYAAPCTHLNTSAPLRWLKLGWRDLKRAPGPSLIYGMVMMCISYLVSFFAIKFGSIYFLLSMLSGFILLGPVIAIGLYSVSCQLQEGRKPVLGHCLREGRRHFANVIVFALILLVVFLIWARVASMLHIFYPVETDASWQAFALFFAIGSVVGAVFSAIIFVASAFSLPMIMDRKTDMVTAVVTSVHAVLCNKKTMLLWALLIVVSVLLSFATLFAGFLLFLPLIGYATWHAYQETIDASQWPRH